MPNTNIVDISSKNSLFRRQFLRDENLQAVLFLTCSILIFLSTPLFRYNTSYFLPADTSQIFTVSRFNEEYKAPVTVSDVSSQYIPWLMFSKEEYQAGKIPLWNPYNANGMPQAANFQARSFSPYSLPYYILPLNLAVLVAAFLYLFTHGFFTFLYLKKISLRQVPALFGGIIYMYCLVSVVWLLGPPGEPSIVIPMGLYFLESVFQKSKKSSGFLDFLGLLAGFTLSLVLGVLAGHAELLYYSVLFLVFYTIFRLIYLFRVDKLSIKTLLTIGCQLVLSGLLAVGLTAYQIFIFVEYLLNSYTLVQRSDANPSNYSAQFWPTLFFPDLVGNSYTDYAVAVNLPPPNHGENGGVYTGGLALFLAFLALRFIIKNKFIAFFGITAIITYCYNFYLLGVQNIIHLIPGTALGLAGRVQFLYTFSIAVCAAFTLDKFYTPENWSRLALLFSFKEPKTLLLARRNLKAGFSVGFLGILFLLVFVRGAANLVSTYASILQLDWDDFQAYVPYHYWSLALTFSLGLLLCMSFWITKKSWQQHLLSLGIVSLIFFQTGYTYKDYNHTTEAKYYQPITPAIKKLQETVGNDNLLLLGFDVLYPHTNMSYKLHVLPHYDALSVKTHSEVTKQFLGKTGSITSLDSVDEKFLQLFGINYIVAGKDELNLDRSTERYFLSTEQNFLVGPLTSEKVVEQEFIAVANDFRFLRLWFETTKQQDNNCQLSLKLIEVASQKEIVSQNVICQQLTNNGHFDLVFPIISDAKSKKFRLTVTSNSFQADKSVSLKARHDLNIPNSAMKLNGTLQEGNLLFELFCGNPDNFEKITRLAEPDGRNLYRVKNSPGRYFMVNQARYVEDSAKALLLLQTTDFYPGKEVILSGMQKPGLTNSNQGLSSVQIVKEESDKTNLKVQSSNPGFLVLNITKFPGWKVKVNGVEKPLLTANYTFNAVEVPNGESLVEFYYAPQSFLYGIVIAATTLLLILGGVAFILFRRKSKRVE